MHFIDLLSLFPFASKAYLNGVNVFLVHLHDGLRAAIYFDKVKGCFVIEREGRRPEILLDTNGRSVKTLETLYKLLKGIEEKTIVKVSSREIER
jgi:hypothetical protein